MKGCSPTGRARGRQPTQLPPCTPYVRLPPSSPPAPASPGHLSGPRSICPAHPLSLSASSAWRRAHPPAGRAAKVTAGGSPSGPQIGGEPLDTPLDPHTKGEPCLPQPRLSSAPQHPSCPIPGSALPHTSVPVPRATSWHGLSPGQPSGRPQHRDTVPELWDSGSSHTPVPLARVWAQHGPPPLTSLS